MAALLAQPARPRPLRKVLLPPAGCCSPAETGRGKKARQGWDCQNRHPGPGAGRRCPPWGDSSQGPNWQLQKEIRAERMGDGSAELLACTQALLQPLLFPESKRQTIKKRVRGTCPTVMYTGRKEGLRSIAAPDPSDGPFPQRD